MATATTQVGVELVFSANTSQAEQSVKTLQQNLEALGQGTANRNLFGSNATTDQINKASAAAKTLAENLTKATNTDTGRLNFTQFNSQLAQAGTSVRTLTSALTDSGVKSSAVFLQTGNAIASADAKMGSLLTKTSGLNSLVTQFAKTAMSMVSGSIIRGITSSITNAISYVESLNSSLNNIRIVSGESVAAMDKFAEKANKAAQALGSTTTAFTNAALIYYQQGLRTEEDIMGRTETTIKMANVTGDSAATVSEQLTAIWNNFDDYGDEFERYADIITALGAATASSTDEISEGLGKFAAAANTVGLSYDYATSALATLIAATRESPETIGTALKTLFTRLQGLSLGDTLDDGVNLNKYSNALKKVGVDILDVNGEMKTMDEILNSLAAKWDNLTQAQKMALAQTVAGARQYTMLISLMDNWDSMQTNLSTASTAEGTVESQNQIYLESVAASQQQLKATLQDVYTDLIDDDFLIWLNKLETSFVKVIGAIIDGMGGIKGLLPTIAALFMNTFSDKITQNLNNMTLRVKMLADNMKGIFVKGYNAKSSDLNYTQKAALTTFDNQFGTSPVQQQTTAYDGLRSKLEITLQLQNQFNAATRQLSDAEATKLKESMDGVANAYQRAENSAKMLKATEGDNTRIKAQLDTMAPSFASGAPIEAITTQGLWGTEADRKNTINSSFGAEDLKFLEEQGVQLTGDQKDLRNRMLNYSSNTAKGRSEARERLLQSLNHSTTNTTKDAMKKLYTEGPARATAQGVEANWDSLSDEQKDLARKAYQQGFKGEKYTAPKGRDAKQAKYESEDAMQKFQASLSDEQRTKMIESQAQGVDAKKFESLSKVPTEADKEQQANYTKTLESLEQVAKQTGECTIKAKNAEQALQEMADSGASTEDIAKKANELANSLGDTESISKTFGEEVGASFDKLKDLTAEGSNASLQQIQDAFADLTSKLQNSGDTGSAALEKLNQNLQELADSGASTEDVAKKADELANSLGDAASISDTFGEAAGESFKNLKTLTAAGSGASTQQIQDAFTDLTSKILSSGKAGGVASQQMEKLKQDLIQMKVASGATAEQIEEFKQQLDAYANGSQVAGGRTAQLANDEGQLADQSKRVEQELVNAADAAKRWKKQVEQTSVAAGFAAGVAAINSTISALNSFKSAYSAISNPDLSAWEKMVTISSSLSMGIGMLTSSFSQYKTMAAGCVKLVTSLSAGHGTLATKLAAYIVQKKIETGAVKEENKAEAINLALKKAQIALIVLAVVAAAAIIVGIVALVKHLQEQNSALAQAQSEYDQTTAAVNNMSSAVEEAANHVQELSDAYDNFTDKRAALDDLTVGTIEWNKALLESNQAMLDLIDKYPQLADYLTTDENGVMGFSDEEAANKIIADAQEAAIAQQRAAQAGLNAAKIDQAEAQEKLDVETSIANNGKLTKYADAEYEYAGVKITQDEYDNLSSSEKASAIQTKAAQNLTYDQYEAIKGVLAETKGFTDPEDKAKLKTALAATGVDQEYLDAIVNNTDLLQSIQATMITTENTIAANTTALVTQKNMDNEDYANSEYKSLLNQIGEKKVQDVRAASEAGDTKQLETLLGEQAYIPDETVTNNKVAETYFAEQGIQATQGADGLYYTQDGSTRYALAADGTLTQETKNGDSWAKTENFSKTREDMVEAVNIQRAGELTPEEINQANAAAQTLYNQLYSQYATTYQKAGVDVDEDTLAEQVHTIVNSGQLTPLADGTGYEIKIDSLAPPSVDDYTYEDAAALLAADSNFFGEGIDLDALKTNRHVANLEASATWDDEGYDEASLEASKDALDMTDAGVEALTQSLIKNNERLQEHQDLADEVAQVLLENQVGYNQLTDAMDDYSDTLDTADKDSVEYAQALGAITDAMTEWMGDDWTTQDTIDHLEDIKLAAEGDEEAIIRLQDVATKNIILNLDVENSVKDTLTSIDADIDKYLADNNYEIGMTLDETDMQDKLQALLDSGAMTAEQMNEFLGSIGFNPEIELQTVDVGLDQADQMVVGGTITTTDGRAVTVTDAMVHEFETNSTITIPTINAEKTAYAGKKPSAKKSSSSSGGGGGSSKQKEKKQADNSDRYHTVDQQLEDISNQLDELSSAEDRAFGYEKVNLMAQELAKLNAEVGKYGDKLKEANNYLAEDKTKAEEFASKIGMSIEYGANGEITNWDALKKGYLDWYNAGVDSYNSGGIDDDAFDKQYEEVYDDAMDAFDQLEETNNLVQELKQNILDAQREYEDMYLSIQKEKLELNITLEENDMKMLEYFFDKLNDDLYDSVDRMSILEDEVGNLIRQASAYESNINNLLGSAGEWQYDESGIPTEFVSYGLNLDNLPELLDLSDEELYNVFGGEGSNVQEIVDQLQNDYENLISTNQSIAETREKLISEIGTSFDSWNQEIDDAEQTLEDNASLMEHYRNVIDIVGRKTLGITSDFIKDYNMKQLDNDLAQLTTSYAQLNEQRAAVSALEQAIMKETSDETRELMQNELDEMQKTLTEQAEDTATKWEECMRGIQEAYEDTVSVALDDWKNKMAGLAGSADNLSNAFDMATELDDNYLEDYDKIYELTKLSADINNSIDDTDNLQSKQDLIDLMTEVNELNESDADISQYTLDILQARYDLLKAEEAFKEAQNAKSTVRLTQDNEGNWGYVYTADQDAVTQAEQEYADKLHALEEINQNYIDDLDEKIANLSADMADKIQTIAEDTALSFEERKEKMEEVYEAVNEQQQYLLSQTTEALEDAQEIYEIDAQKYSDLTGAKMLDDEKWTNSFEEMKYSQIAGFQTLEEWDQAFGTNWQETVQGLENTTDEYVEKNAEAFSIVGMDINTASEDMSKDLNEIAQNTDEVKSSIEDLADAAESEIQETINFTQTWSTEWSKAIDAIVAKNEMLITSCDSLISKLADAQAANDILSAEETELMTLNDVAAEGDEGSRSDGGGTNCWVQCSGICGGACQRQCKDQTQKTPVDRSSSKDLLNTALSNFSLYDGGLSCVLLCQGACKDSCKNGCKGSCKGDCKGRCTYACADSCTDSCGGQDVNGKTTSVDTGGYTGTMQYADTGMYTGSWPNGSVRDNGRLAFLHQKELVLNAHDTENFLSAVDIVRSLSENLDLGAAAMSKGIGNISAQGLSQETNATIDQNVSITAEFPNVQDRNEIEEAFNNLINKAAQYANRKR